MLGHGPMLSALRVCEGYSKWLNTYPHFAAGHTTWTGGTVELEIVFCAAVLSKVQAWSHIQVIRQLHKLWSNQKANQVWQANRLKVSNGACYSSVDRSRGRAEETVIPLPTAYWTVASTTQEYPKAVYGIWGVSPFPPLYFCPSLERVTLYITNEINLEDLISAALAINFIADSIRQTLNKLTAHKLKTTTKQAGMIFSRVYPRKIDYQPLHRKAPQTLPRFRSLSENVYYSKKK